MMHKYFRNGLKTALLICSFIALSNATAHADVWDGSSVSSSLKGSGSQDDPYQIWTGADLKYLQQTESLWDFGIYIVQKDDIDLDNHELGNIGYGTNAPFSATYDGSGCKISNLYIDWTDVSSADKYSHALFGYLCGTVRNIHIDKALASRTANTSTSTNADIKIAILAAAVSPNNSVSEAKGGHKAVIENIIITNSRIEDNAGTATPQYLSLYVGGVVGDIASSFGGYSNMTSSYGTVTINNIYCEVDIDLPNVIRRSGTSDNQKNQYNVGGVAARMRRGKYADIPTSCVYRGKINAPLATIAPVFGFSRCNSSHSASLMTDAYLWEVFEDDSSSNTWVPVTSPFTLGGKTYNPDEERYFSDYSIYDTSTSSYVTITDAYPVANSTRYGVRTLDERDASVITHDYQDATTLRAWQGVNHGTYIDLNTGDGRTKIAEMLSKNSKDPSVTFAWNAAGDDMYFSVPDTVALSRPTLHTVYAELPNYRSSNTYLYCWTITKTDGTTDQVTVSSANGPQTLYGYTVTPSLGACTILLPDECNNYASVTLDVQNAKGTSLCTDDIEIGALSYSLQYTVDDTDGNVYVYTPKVMIGDEVYDINDDMLQYVTCNWQIMQGDSWVSLASNSSLGSVSSDTRTATVTGSYMGALRVYLTDTEISGSTYDLISSGTLNYAENTIQSYHLSVTMWEYDPSTGEYIRFDPSHYFSSSMGYNLYKDTEGNVNPKGYVLTTTANEYPITLPDNTILYLDTKQNLLGTLKDTNYRPIVFKAAVVSEFGDTLTDDANHGNLWRIQWCYKIPGDGVEDERKSPNYNEDQGYNLVNGYLDSSASNYGIDLESSGEHTDWVAAYHRNHNTDYDINFKTDRWGQYKVDELGTRFMIHPNLLHCTSSFTVRARLYSVAADPEGAFPDEEILNFGQVVVDCDRIYDANNELCNYSAKLVWRGVDSSSDDYLYTTTSQYTFYWQTNSDPTNPNGWEDVVSHVIEKSSLAGPREDTLIQDGERITFNPDLYYRIKIVSGSGSTYSDIVGPVNVIFVYDRGLTIANATKHSFDYTTSPTGEGYADGQDYNHGHDPENAVHTIERAYELLDSYANGGTRATNKIVIMGYYANNDYLYFKNGTNYYSETVREESPYNKHVTLTGAFGQYVSGDTWGWEWNENSKSDIALIAPLTLENLDIYTKCNQGVQAFYCYNHDFTVDKGVRMVNFPALSDGMGQADNAKVVNLTLVAGSMNDNIDRSTTPLPTYEDNETLGVCTMILKSGAYGRIMGCARNNQSNGTAHNIFGSPDYPCRTRLTVDIQKENPDNIYEFIVSSGTFTHDIGLLVGGQTDGSVYGDVVIDFKSGYVSRFIAGNITWARRIGGYPDDSFFGSTVLNIYGGTIQQLYGGCLGRHGEGSSMLKGYMYGRSIINLYGGTIGDSSSEEFSLYAAGAGCITGIGRDWGYEGMGTNSSDDTGKRSYTPDDTIPYYDNSGNLLYGDYDTATQEGNTIPTMIIYDHDGKSIDADGNSTTNSLYLQDTYVEANLYGGIVNGDIFGGGYGYSNVMSGTHWTYAPYRTLKDDVTRRVLSGTLYGNAYINLLPNPDGNDPVKVYGNIYGGGSGALNFIENSGAGSDGTVQYGIYTYDFNHLAQVFGNVSINIEDGVVMGGVYGGKERGNVFGGGMGKNGFPSMGNIYGNCSVTISGGEIQGNVYGGSAYSDIQKYSAERLDNEGNFIKTYDQGGNTSVNISGGTFGNCIFGGGLGCLDDAANNQVETSSNIEGNTSVIITGGRFSQEAYTYYYDADGNQLTDTDGNPVRTQNNFNIYGGGYINGVIDGNAEVMIKAGLLYDEESLGEGWTFEDAWNDITYRRFCVYGGGWGENTLVEGNANIRLDIPEDGKVAPTDQAITELVPGQTFFDVAGGGYAGDVGYWVDDTGNKSLNKPAAERTPDTFAKYKNGNLLLTVSGYPFVRKVVGGGFYSQCNNADTYIFGGSIQEVYGGALMGYVHKNARLYIGQPNIDMNEWELTRYNFSRHTNLSVEELASVNADRRENAYNRNHSLFIVGNVYGGNDVKGVVGTSKWYDKYKDEYTDEEIETIETGSTTRFGMESSDNAPLYCSDVEAVDTKGVTMTINGGTICGNVYGVGNGHYRGYYVPGWARYGDGPARQYRKALLPGKTHADYKVNTDGTDNADQVYGNVYRCRPMTGKVTIHISGNGTDDQGRMDSVSIRGNVYGGGRACTLGQWNTALPYEDPRRLTKGGFLHINIGSNVNIDGSVYMGSEGTEFATAHEVPSDIDLSTFKGTTSEELDKLGAVAYDHWYYDATDKYYKPGFPAADQVGGNIGIYGEHMYRAYFKNIEMQGDVEITFYNEPFEKENGEYVKTYDSDDEEYFVRRRWVPGEMAISEYDATNITINSFYGGGACGSMTNNNQMYWNYTTGKITDLSDVKSTDEVEKNGAIYRYILSPGVTILDRAVGGSENATNRYYGYEADNKTLRASNDDNLIYEFEGGMVTQSTYTYYLLAYNADKGQNIHDVKPSEYLGETYEKGLYTTKYEISEGSYIAPQYYTQGLKTVPNALYLQNPRFAIAVSADANGNALAGYCGAREDRPDKTVLKLTVANQFEPQKGEQEYTGSVEDPTEHYYHFGGVIYGGCYDSGVTQGDVMVSVLSNTIGKHLSEKDPTTFDDISTLEHNIGRVFGGGYGSDSRVDGDTYVNLMHHFVGMNVFGGGCQGNVNGMTHIKYVGDEANSFVFGAIYGGGLYGNVGVALDANNPDHDPTPIATEVRLFSGNVDKVYGGACLGDLYGRTHVELCDEVYDQLEYFNYGLLTPTLGDWSGARLIAGTVFGGNDVSGNIYPQPTAGEALNKEEVENNNAKPDYGINAYSTYVKVHEIVQQPTQAPSAAPALSEEVNPGKESPGASNGYNGFPLIGDLYGGSNGSYGSHSGLDYYEGGTYRLASGLGNHVIEFDLAPDPTEDYAGFQVPHVEKAYLDIQGGTLINVYGGGDKATITGETNLNVNYSPTDSIMRARAGFAGSDALVRIWNTFHLSDEEQIEEVTTTTGTGDDANTIFNYHIYRIYGGNNNADMAIQPTWNLVSGYLGSVYSGGNFGKMTYCKATGNKVDYTDATTNTTTQVPELEALKLVINSSTLHADAVFGGGRVGDIEPDITGALKNATPTTLTLTNDNYITYNPNFYGATLEINDGVVDHVYGGNDVSGTVYQGSRVKITGAISGDVYCAGNGNYRYQYDYTNDADGAKIAEAYGSDNYGGRYFILPMRTEKDGNEYVYGGSTNPTPTQILQAINAYRPNVERTYLTIEGTGPVYGKDSEGNDIVTKEAVTAFVRGNVYCGGNSSTVNHSDATDTNGDIKFEIGSYVVLNGVFLGSNGESLVDPDMMEVTERLNGIDLTEACDLKDYPALLDLYMQAVEITGLPKDFNLSPSLQEAYIGDFYVGGNNGSMLTDKTIGLTFPYNLVIYNRIVGGSNSANVTYRGTSHIGGLTTPLSTETVINSKGVEEPKYTDKVYLQVRSQFKPFKIKYVDDVDNRSISLVPDLDYDGSHIYFPEGKCSIFGGCYNSGRTVGNIHIDLYSDMVKEWDTSTFSDYFDDLKQEATDMGYDIDWANVSIDELFSKDRVIVNGIDQLQRRSFALIGGGYGSATEVLGNIKLHMLPGQFHPDYYYYDELGNVVKTEGDLSPSTATIFGGSQQGSVIGNTEIAVRDGMVLSNLYGGSEAAPLYGSTQIMIGWPQYYKCNVRGHYRLKRNDDISRAAIGKWKNSDGADKETVLRDIWLREGEYISPNLFEALVSVVTTSTDLTTGETTDTESTIPTDNFTFVGDDLPQFYAAHNNSPYVEFHKINWDDIDIYIGNGRSRRDERQEYFAHGNVYGGGFITSNSSTSLAGQFTVKKFDELNNNDENDIGYGGNSSIMIWDNIENRDTRNVVGETAQYDYTGAAYESDDNPAKIRDHITIGTGHYVEVTMYPGMDVMGKYIFEPTETGRSYLYVGTGKGDYEYNSTSNSYSAKSGGDYKRGDYIAQSSKILTDKDFNTDGTSMDTYYEIESDGGVYGGGRKVYVEGFRNCDLAYYGYADYCPQFPKLLNTAQRLDLFTVTDCCFFLEGANDFSTNTIDATNYSLTRIGELQMRSSISADAALDPGTRQTSGLFNSEHLNARCRNYIGFFHDVLYVAAMTSNVAFDQAYRGADGMLYSLNAPSGNPTSSTGSSSTTWATDDDYTYLDATFTYQDYKKNRIENYYANCNNASSSETLKRATSLEFDQRNVGTAANMIGINNGYTLKVQGAGLNNGIEDIYYGPVTGVFEVKLMTLSTDEGGGYIYALNQHDDPNHFLETTGNFIFPGAAYKLSSTGNEYNYIYDDCFPYGLGWENYYGWTGASSAMHPRKASTAVDTGHGDCNALQEVHYWFVNGSQFTFNVNLTGVTYNNPKSFTLNSRDLLTYLYGVPSCDKVTLEEVYWTPINGISWTSTGWSGTDESGYTSDLQDLSPADQAANAKGYKLYLTLDNIPATEYTESSGREVIGLPRASTYVENNNLVSLDQDFYGNGSLSYSSTIVNSDGEKEDNMPLLGITLYDPVVNTGTDYYNNHMAENENVRIVLYGRDSSGNKLFQYTINLTINYLMGPSISGVPRIENCALPGEYIYANADDVVVLLDDSNLAITGHNWYIMKGDLGTSETAIAEAIKTIPTGSNIGEDIECINDQRISNVETEIHIPAYYYRDGWNLVYEIVANNSDDMRFYRTPYSEDNTDTTTVASEESEGTEGSESTGGTGTTVTTTEDTELKHLVVHNYHRMRPYDGASRNDDGTIKLEDLRLTAGARIYIEDQDDMDYFFKWLNDSCMTRPNPRVTASGLDINPENAEGLIVHLMADLDMPRNPGVDVSNLEFAGIFHGNGHSIDMGSNNMFLGTNQGVFYNTGFICKSDNTTVFGANTSDTDKGLWGCFLFNNDDRTKGLMVAGDNGSIYNCYRTSGATTANNVVGLTLATDDEFTYGEIAYDLNHFYLKKRYNRATNTSDGTFMLPLNDIFYDGDYRYSRVQDADQPWALRTTEVPNYHDINIKRTEVNTGHLATHHYTTDDQDLTRLAQDAAGNALLDKDGNEYYLPIFPDDYRFFGQDLSYGQKDEPWPHAVVKDQIVYRASGFYGSKLDQGFHFNEDAVAQQPSLTAIDFYGVRDEEYGVASTNGYSIDYDGDDAKSEFRHIWYAPAVDLPDAYATETVENHGILSFTTASQEENREIGDYDSTNGTLTRNLLVYRPDEMSVLAPYDNTEVRAENIYYHVIDATASSTDSEGNVTTAMTPNADYFQLIDREDFNCPIAFDVNKTIWYRRTPELFSNGNDAWDGLCLPFTARTVFGSIDGQPIGYQHNHGELSHFYGEHVKADNKVSYLETKADSHEYWLRKFTEIKDSKAYFERPGSENDLSANADLQEAKIATYHYSNQYFSALYGDSYYTNNTHGDQAPGYTEKGIDYKDYPMITARYPYIISFPGKRYREFDCSGEFFATYLNTSNPGCQTITYADTQPQKILMTDAYTEQEFTHNGYTFKGSYMHRSLNAYQLEIDTNNGQQFERGSASRMIEPFRTYLVSADNTGQSVQIASRGIDSIGEGDDEEDGDSQESNILFSIESNELVIDNPYDVDFEFGLYDLNGRYLRSVTATPGLTRVSSLSPGYYLISTFKFRIN